jgi:hypothetical protein
MSNLPARSKKTPSKRPVMQKKNKGTNLCNPVLGVNDAAKSNP